MTTELKAGLMVLAATASLFYMTTKLTENRFSFSGTKRYYALVHDATGLLTKSKVKMAGLDIGQLKDIELSGKRARLVMDISAQLLIHQDATIAVKSIGFLGDKYIELSPGSETSPVMPEGGTITESAASGGIDQLTAKTIEVMDNLKEITDVLRDAIHGEDDEEDTRLDRILDNMEQFSSGLAQLDKLGELAEHLDEVSKNLADITNKVKRGEGTIGKLLNDNETIDKLNATLSGVNKLVTKADKLAIIVDAHSGYLAQTGGVKTTASLIIQPTFDKYYLLGITSSPQGTSNLTTTTTTTNPGQTGSSSVVTQQNTTNQTAIGIDAQFAKRFGDFVAKAGLFETTGGLGVDYLLDEDKIKLYSEIYRFQKGSHPQANVGTDIYLYRPFYAWLGGEDLLNPGNRNFVIGAGMRFSDQDIKSLVTAAVLR